MHHSLDNTVKQENVFKLSTLKESLLMSLPQKYVYHNRTANQYIILISAGSCHTEDNTLLLKE